MEHYQKKGKKMSEYEGMRKLTATFNDEQMDRFLAVFGQMNRSKLIRDLVMKAVREKEMENKLQQNESNL